MIMSPYGLSSRLEKRLELHPNLLMSNVCHLACILDKELGCAPDPILLPRCAIYPVSGTIDGSGTWCVPSAFSYLHLDTHSLIPHFRGSIGPLFACGWKNLRRIF